MVRWNGMRGTWAATVAVVTVGLGALMTANPAVAQITAPTPARVLVDIPTAGLVPEAAFETQVRAFPGGGLRRSARDGFRSPLPALQQNGRAGRDAGRQPDPLGDRGHKTATLNLFPRLGAGFVFAHSSSSCRTVSIPTTLITDTQTSESGPTSPQGIRPAVRIA